MSEYINREKLLKRFNIDDMMNVNGTLISLRDAREVISNFPAVSVPQWISVKDRLPRNYIEVMVFDAIDRDMFLGAIGSSGEWEIPRFRTDKLNITHWMPLPEPPKGDADNG